MQNENDVIREYYNALNSTISADNLLAGAPSGSKIHFNPQYRVIRKGTTIHSCYLSKFKTTKIVFPDGGSMEM